MRKSAPKLEMQNMNKIPDLMKDNFFDLKTNSQGLSRVFKSRSRDPSKLNGGELVSLQSKDSLMKLQDG